MTIRGGLNNERIRLTIKVRKCNFLIIMTIIERSGLIIGSYTIDIISNGRDRIGGDYSSGTGDSLILPNKVGLYRFYLRKLLSVYDNNFGGDLTFYLSTEFH